MKLVTRDGRTYPLNRERISIGRSSSNDIHLSDEQASGHHALLRREGSTYVLTDQNSTNGTYVNRRRLHGAYRLEPGDVIGIGRTLLKVTGAAHAQANRTVVADRMPDYAPSAPPPSPYQQPAGQPYYAPQAAPQPQKDRTTAGLLAILLGNIGIHKFYLNQSGMGILYLLFSWTFIPGIIGLVEGIQYLTMTDQQFHQRFG